MYVCLHMKSNYELLVQTYHIVAIMVQVNQEINVDHRINVDQQSKPRDKCKYSIDLH
jgi:hypothetical protein